MSYASLTAELAGQLPGLSTLLAGPFIQRAYRDIQTARIWSFQTTDGAIICPAQIVAGTVAFDQGLDQVVCDATASLALSAFLTSNPTLTQMQIRFGGPNNTTSIGQIYNIRIASYVAGIMTLTLQRPIVEATSAASGYQCYRCYVQAPVSDFTRFTSMMDVAQAQPVKLDYTSAYFDAMDPQRSSQGQAYYLGHYQSSQAVGQNPLGGIPLYELWPHPTQGQTFYVRIRRRGQPLALPADVQPDIIPDELILDKAFYKYAYPWCKANAGHFPALKGINWDNLIVAKRNDFLESYRDVKRTDDENRLQSLWNRGHGLRGRTDQPFPLDANFLQSHLVNY